MRAGDIRRVDFGEPIGSEPGLVRPALLVTSDTVLERNPRTVHVVPITSNVLRALPTDVLLVSTTTGSSVMTDTSDKLQLGEA